MSALTSVSNSGGAAYATQVAQTSALKRSLSNLGTAIQKGDLAAASSILSSIMKANPQYAAASAGDTAAQSPINQDFQALSKAVTNHQADAAKSAWTKTKNDLGASGISTTNNSAADTAKLLAQSKKSQDQQILGALFGDSSSLSLGSLIGASSPSTKGPDLSSVVSNWLAYKATGKVSTTTAPEVPFGSVDSTA